MDIYYSHYQLTPLKRINRLSSLDPKQGVYLKAAIGGTTVYADYFPHIPLGDRSVDQFLSEFKDQQYVYDQKVLNLLVKDQEYQQQEILTFRNHQLWTGSEPIEAKLIKYKLMGQQDSTFLEPLRRGVKVRLDGNGLFTRTTFEKFLSYIPPELHKQIEYIEDPLREGDWTELPIPCARDFIESNYCDYYIYKPNCEFFPEFNVKVIFSAYLGSDLGTWHTYCEMIREGDLSLTQGIVAQDFYQEERKLLKGNYQDGICPDKNVVKNIYQELELRNWKSLCTI